MFLWRNNKNYLKIITIYSSSTSYLISGIGAKTESPVIVRRYDMA